MQYMPTAVSALPFVTLPMTGIKKEKKTFTWSKRKKKKKK
jgi:hypothetical protein